MRKTRKLSIAKVQTLAATIKLTFRKKHLDRLRELYPEAKYFLYIKLPEKKEVSFVVNKGANLKKSLKEQLNHLKTEFHYTDEQLTNIETYDLGVK